MTDWKVRCAELANYLQGRKDLECGWGEEDPEQDLIDRTRAELAKPEPVGPGPVDYQRWHEAPEQLLRHWHGRITASARWGRPAIEPVPVSERLPGEGDCDAEGRCWWSYDSSCDDPFRDGSPPNDPRWFLRKDGPESPNWIHRIRWHIPCVHPTHWLPHWALPVPTSQGILISALCLRCGRSCVD